MYTYMASRGGVTDHSPMTNLTYGDWLKEQRAIRRITQTDLEDAAKLGPKYVSKLEAGIIRTPRDNVRERIHEALGTSDEDLVSAGIFSKITHEGDTVYLPRQSQKGLGITTPRTLTGLPTDYVKEELARAAEDVRWNQGLLDTVIAQIRMIESLQRSTFTEPRASWEDDQ